MTLELIDENAPFARNLSERMNWTYLDSILSVP